MGASRPVPHRPRLPHLRRTVGAAHLSGRFPLGHLDVRPPGGGRKREQRLVGVGAPPRGHQRRDALGCGVRVVGRARRGGSRRRRRRRAERAPVEPGMEQARARGRALRRSRVCPVCAAPGRDAQARTSGDGHAAPRDAAALGRPPRRMDVVEHGRLLRALCAGVRAPARRAGAAVGDDERACRLCRGGICADVLAPPPWARTGWPCALWR